MKYRAIAIITVLGILAGAAYAKEASKVDLSKVKCMFSGKACKETASADHNGGKVHFCCGNCVKKFNKDAAKYVLKANHHLVATKQATQKKCPLSGGKAKDSTKVDVQGVGVTFCCNKCEGKVAAATGDDQLKLVFSEKAFKKGFEVAKKN